MVPCGDTAIPEAPRYRVDGRKRGCPEPYFNCTREADAKARERYILQLEALRDEVKRCRAWAAGQESGEEVELLEDVDPDAAP